MYHRQRCHRSIKLSSFVYTNGSTQFHIIHTVLQLYNVHAVHRHTCTVYMIIEKKSCSGCVGVALRPHFSDKYCLVDSKFLRTWTT